MFSLASTEITELVLTRVSHDLIGNIGAVANAVELLEDDSAESVSEIKPILDISSKTLTSRLKFFRLAFGLKNAAPKNIQEMKDIAESYLKTIGNVKTPINVYWNVENISLYKILYLGLMSLADVFIKGGKIDIEEKSDGIVLRAQSDFDLSQNKLQFIKDALHGSLNSENPALMAPTVYLAALIDEAGASVSFSFSDKQALLNIN